MWIASQGHGGMSVVGQRSGFRRAIVFAIGCALAPAGCAAIGAGPSATGPLLPSMQVYTAGDAVTVVLQVTNTSDSAIELNFPTGQTYEFVVEQGGREVWRWSEGQAFTQALRQERVEPGETLRFEAIWPATGSPTGSFVATGSLTASNYEVEQSTGFELR
ncbi:MAG: BsuPI-related putative proteinase inhibitor [Gemmatimonadota bacterium]